MDTNLFMPSTLITNALKPLGYKKKGTSWWKRTDGLLVFLKMYAGKGGGPDRYLDARVIFDKLDNKKYVYHISRRIHELSELHNALGYFHEGKELSDSDRVQRLQKALNSVVIPVLTKMESIEGIKDLLATEDRTLMITPEARQLLSES